jgi:hypothetical protein
VCILLFGGRRRNDRGTMRGTRAWVVLMAVALTAGCGGGGDSGEGPAARTSFADRSAAQIGRAASADMKGISSVHVRGTTGSGDAPVTLDIVVGAADDCEGSLTVGLASTQLMASGKKLWLKPDEEFLVAQLGLGADTFSQISDRWIA